MGEKELLMGTKDVFGGLIIDLEKEEQKEVLQLSPEAFSQLLQESEKEWRSQKKRGIWLKIPTTHSSLYPVALQEGFTTHHATPTHIQTTKWLPETENTLPPYAHHGLGAGGFVMDKANRVLVVQEKNGPITNIWKLPGGMVDHGEPLAEAAVREVWEETGVKVEFKCVAGMMETSPGPFQTTSLYCVCVCEPLSSEINIQEREIQAAKWMDIDEFLNLPYWRKAKGWYNLFKMAKNCAQNTEKGWEKQPFKMFNRTARVYVPSPGAPKSRL